MDSAGCACLARTISGSPDHLAGQRTYLDRAVDQHGQVIDVLLPAINIIAGRRDPYRHLRRCATIYPADSGQTDAQAPHTIRGRS
jgi:hypothetical protein